LPPSPAEGLAPRAVFVHRFNRRMWKELRQEMGASYSVHGRSRTFPGRRTISLRCPLEGYHLAACFASTSWVIEAVAEAFGVGRAAVTIARGARGRRKTLVVEGATPAALDTLLAGAG
jgi:hypothetical protein